MESEYFIGLWDGCGYVLDTFKVAAYSAEEALEKVTRRIINDGQRGLYLTTEEIEVYAQDEGIKPEEYAQMYNLAYIDGTMSGAAFPVYVRGENLTIQKIA